MNTPDYAALVKRIEHLEAANARLKDFAAGAYTLLAEIEENETISAGRGWKIATLIYPGFRKDTAEHHKLAGSANERYGWDGQ